MIGITMLIAYVSNYEYDEKSNSHELKDQG